MSAPARASGAPGEDTGFRRKQTVKEEVRRLSRQSARSGYRVYRGRDGFEAAIPEHLVERLPLWGKQAAPNECYALLVGRVFEDERGRHVVILGAVPDPDAEAEHSFVRTTPESEWKTRFAARQLYPDCIIIGWLHSHIRYGILYSGVDRQNQATWIEPHSIGIVVDPWHPDLLSVYRGPGAERLTLVADTAPCAPATVPVTKAPRASPHNLERVVTPDAAPSGQAAGMTPSSPALDKAPTSVSSSTPPVTPKVTRSSSRRLLSATAALFAGFVLASIVNAAFVASTSNRFARREAVLTERVQRLEQDVEVLATFIAVSAMTSEEEPAAVPVCMAPEP